MSTLSNGPLPQFHRDISRRDMLGRMGSGCGLVGLAAVLADEMVASRPMASAAEAASVAGAPLAPKAPHHSPKARRVIHLFMNGGPSQVDTFDPKPALEKYAGQAPPAELVNTMRRTKGTLMPSPFKFAKQGQAGIEVSELFPHLSRCIDDICLIRSMHTNLPNHEPSFLMMNSGETQPICFFRCQMDSPSPLRRPKTAT